MFYIDKGRKVAELVKIAGAKKLGHFKQDSIYGSQQVFLLAIYFSIVVKPPKHKYRYLIDYTAINYKILHDQSVKINVPYVPKLCKLYF